MSSSNIWRGHLVCVWGGGGAVGVGWGNVCVLVAILNTTHRPDTRWCTSPCTGHPWSPCLSPPRTLGRLDNFRSDSLPSFLVTCFSYQRLLGSCRGGSRTGPETPDLDSSFALLVLPQWMIGKSGSRVGQVVFLVGVVLGPRDVAAVVALLLVYPFPCSCRFV